MNRRQRRAKLVRHGRDEVVFHPVELEQPLVLLFDERPCVFGVDARVVLACEQLFALCLHPPALRDITDDAGDSDHLAVVVAERRERDRYVDEPAALVGPLDLVRVHAVLREHQLEVVLQ